MRKLSAVLLLATTFTAGAQSITSTNNFTWSPDVLTVTAGTEITITVTGNHHMREVSEATWNANQNTSNGGFDFLAGTHALTLTDPGTYWYVCVPHVTSGMKGMIIVEGGNSVGENINTNTPIMFPNPVSNTLNVTAPLGAQMITLIAADGRVALRTSLNGVSTIDIASVTPGNYVALFTNEQRTIIARSRVVIAR